MVHAEANARTVDAAIAAAAAQLGLRPDQVEVEVLEEATPTTFGVIGRPARVRVTPRVLEGSPAAPVVSSSAAPAPTPALVTPGGDSAPPDSPVPRRARTPLTGAPDRAGVAERQDAGTSAAPRRSEAAENEEEPDARAIEADTELAGDFLEGLLDILDLDGDLTTWIDGYGGHVDLEGSDLDVLVGSDGETLQALQELTRLAVLRQARHRVRLVVDVNGFRSRRRDDLVAAVTAAVERVLERHEEEELQPMPAADRKIVHDVVAAVEGVRTESFGEEPHRRVIILPA